MPLSAPDSIKTDRRTDDTERPEHRPRPGREPAVVWTRQGLVFRSGRGPRKAA